VSFEARGQTALSREIRKLDRGYRGMTAQDCPGATPSCSTWPSAHAAAISAAISEARSHLLCMLADFELLAAPFHVIRPFG
ncbi:hypothetical protein THAOC_07279, partial [Thalassiosira oceanica]